MKHPDIQDVARILNEFGKRIALEGGNPYRAKAYITASETLASINEPLEKVIKAGELQTYSGIGDAMAAAIEVIYQTGTHPKLEELRKKYPAQFLDILEIPGLKTEQILKIYKAGISDIETLEKSLREGKLNEIKGFTPAFQTKLLQGIEIRTQSSGKRHIHKAARLVEDFIQITKKSRPEIRKLSEAGEYRRRCELIGDISIVAVDENLKQSKTIKSGPNTLFLTPPKLFGVMLLYATGSILHIKQLEEIAKSKKLKLTRKGLFSGSKLVASETESEIYKLLGLQYIEPELREGLGEIELASKKKLPKPVSGKDIKGILHAHTTESDGADSLEDMAEAVRTRGYSYFGLSDHSQSAHYAGGLLPGEISEQQKEVDKLNKKYGSKFHIFKGIESDIRADGSLDYPDKILRSFDFIVASVHSQFRLSREEQTQRIIRAVENPYTTILGHMTGRQLLRRHGYDLDIEAVLAACARTGVVVEINANPWRLDLDWRWHQTALKLGCMMSINPDAHSTGEIDLMQWGIAMARKGGVPKSKILNCLTLPEITAFFKQRKKLR